VQKHSQQAIFLSFREINDCCSAVAESSDSCRPNQSEFGEGGNIQWMIRNWNLKQPIENRKSEEQREYAATSS
jgi:hypothetical protein